MNSGVSQLTVNNGLGNFNLNHRGISLNIFSYHLVFLDIFILNIFTAKENFVYNIETDAPVSEQKKYLEALNEIRTNLRI